MIREQVAAFLVAVQFLTRIPVTFDVYSKERETVSVAYYPAVGLLVGGLCAAVFLLADLVFNAQLAVLLALGFGVLCTGAFHEDGLADTWDGIGGGRDRSHALEIMKDSRLGTYGTLALILVLAAKAFALMALPVELIPIVLAAAHGLSRFSSVVVIKTGTYARDHGTGKHTAAGLSSGGFLVAGLTGVLAIYLLSTLGPGFAAGGVLGCVLGHIVMRRLASKKLKGYTGDTLGAVQQISEIGIYFGVAAWVL